MGKVISFKERKILNDYRSPVSTIEAWHEILKNVNMKTEDVDNFLIVSTSPELNVFISNQTALKSTPNTILKYFDDFPEEVCDKQLWAKSLSVLLKISSVLILRHSTKFLTIMGLCLAVLWSAGIFLEFLL